MLFCSLYISFVLSFISKICMFCSVFSITNCSAWLFKQRPLNLYFFLSINLLSVNVAMTDPTPCSILLPSVYTHMLSFLSSCTSVISTACAGCAQCFISIS